MRYPSLYLFCGVIYQTGLTCNQTKFELTLPVAEVASKAPDITVHKDTLEHVFMAGIVLILCGLRSHTRSD